jgi:hypothetical protein
MLPIPITTPLYTENNNQNTDLYWINPAAQKLYTSSELVDKHKFVFWLLFSVYKGVVMGIGNIFKIELRPHHFWTYTSNLTTVVNSVLKFMINGTISILKS